MDSTNNHLFSLAEANAGQEALWLKNKVSSRIFYLLLMILTGTALILLPIIEVDVVARSQGIIQSNLQNNRVAAPIGGQIREVRLRAHQKVAIGDTLFIVNDAKLVEELRRNKERIAEIDHYIYDLTSLIAYSDSNDLPPLKTSLFHYEAMRYIQRRSSHRLTRQHLGQALDLARDLYQSGAIAKVDLEEKQYNYDYEQSNLAFFEDQQRKTWEAELRRYRTDIKTLYGQNQQLMEDWSSYFVLAPIGGKVIEFTGLQPGNFVAPNQPLAYLSSDESLLVEAYVSPADIGLIKPGMPVKYQIDAFHYHQWGLGEGIVDAISNDIIDHRGIPVFKVLCSLRGTGLSLPNGYVGRFKKGMTLTARFLISRRSLFQLLYDKTDDWLNPNVNLLKYPS